MPPEQQARGRQAGPAPALLTRLALLASIAWITGLTKPVFGLFRRPVSWRDIVLVGGGRFLLYKGTREIHHAVEGDEPAVKAAGARASLTGVVAQIMLLDVVFSRDSVITAIGMASQLWVMATAITIAVAIMLAASGRLADFVQRYPTVEMLALSFLMPIGMTLIADGAGAGFHVPRGYIDAAIGFSVGVESLNRFAARRRRPHAAATPTRIPGRSGKFSLNADLGRAVACAGTAEPTLRARALTRSEIGHESDPAAAPQTTMPARAPDRWRFARAAAPPMRTVRSTASGRSSAGTVRLAAPVSRETCRP